MMKEKIAFMISIFLFLGSIPSIQAVQTEESDTAGTISAAFDKELPSVSIMPDSWWYGMKRFFEGVDLFFTFDEVDKAKKCIRYAEMRLAEAREMVAQGESEVIPDLIQEYQSRLNESSTLLQRSQAAGRNAWEVQEYAAVRALLHQEAWDDLQEAVPVRVRAVVHRALNYSQEHADEVLEVLESGEPRVAAEIQLRSVERNIQRIRRNIQENNTETLTKLIRECEEKMNISQRVMERVMDSAGTNCSEVERLFAEVTQQHNELLQQARNSVSSSEIRSVISNALNASDNVTRSIVSITENLLRDSDVFVNESIEQGIQRLAKEFLNVVGN
jgi:predicted RNA-binding Zn ribbon-like protein